ncbi:cytochrome c oxidase assembly factor 7 [Patella vulgata]|uniref:cytochrome c oxidase assembly factor 7 n=1 Tax=Patella vulgata TaxID=6465 RepID=UPI00218030F5|nr:cytochrome c oxidase assembly factor 7 [Patella vulgata]
MDLDLKDEKQAKEYLDRLGIEYRFQCYHENIPDGCHRLADFLEGMRKEFEKAGKVYKTNCDQNKHNQSCFKYGVYSLTGKGGVETDAEKALEYFTNACNLDYSPACHNAGLIHASKKLNTKYDMSKAVEYFENACSKNSVSSCYQLSGIYIQGRDEMEKDLKKAYDYSLKACKLGHVYSCSNLSQMYKKGEGVEKDEKLAEKYKKRTKELIDAAKQGRRIVLNE